MSIFDNYRDILPAIEIPANNPSWQEIAKGVITEGAARALDREFGTPNPVVHPESAPPQGEVFIADTAIAETRENEVDEAQAMGLPFGLTQEQALVGGGLALAVMALGVFALRN